MSCSICGVSTFGPICAACKGEIRPVRVLTTPNRTIKTRALLGYQHPSGHDVVGQQNKDIYTRMRLLIRALNEMGDDMRNLQPMSESLLKTSTQCKKLAIEVEEEMIRREGDL